MRKFLLVAATAGSLLTAHLHAQITISMTASKTNGVAPLGVFFDASATTHTNGSIRPFHDLDFTWNFGDPSSGNWSVTGLSKNTGKGGVYAHVFEQPGTYTVTLTVKDPAGNQSSQQTTITVTDPATVYAGTLTRCVSPTGNFTGAPSGAQQITSNDFDAQILWLLASNGPRRLLLCRTDTFICNAGTGSVNNVTGPFTIGTYGTGSIPVVNAPANTPIDLDTTVLDVRIMDIEFNGVDNTTSQHGITPGREMLMLRCHVQNHSNGISTSSLFGNKSKNIFADNIIENSLSYNIYYNFGMHVAVIGNVLDDVVDEHLFRSYCTHSLIANNHFIRGEGIPCIGVCALQLKFVGYHPTGNPNRDPGTPTEAVEYSIISDNIFEQHTNSFIVVMGPVDASKDQRIENCIFERNIIYSESSTRIALKLEGGTDITVRNNVFDISNGTSIVGGVVIDQLGIEPAPVGHHIYNNTFYKADADRFRTVAFLDATSTDVVIRNNLAFAPLSTDAIMINGSGTNLVASNNIGYFPADPTACVNAGGGSTCVNPMLVNTAGGDFHLQLGSPAIDAGISLNSVFEDFDGNSRPQDGNSSLTAEWDIGAFEYTTSCSNFSASLIATHVSCFGNSNGAINLTVSGGSPQYTYAWSNNATTEDISGLAPASYTCIVTDANMCTVTKTVTIIQPTAALSHSLTVSPATCGNNNGSASVTPAGGTAPYAYSWSNGNVTSSVTGLSGLPADTLMVTVTDANGCTVMDTAVVNCVTAVNENSLEADFAVIPNPSNGVFELMFFSAVNENATLELSNELGQVVYRESLNNFSGRYSKRFDITEFGKGIYWISMKRSNTHLIRKIVTY